MDLRGFVCRWISRTVGNGGDLGQKKESTFLYRDLSSGGPVCKRD